MDAFILRHFKSEKSKSNKKKCKTTIQTKLPELTKKQQEYFNSLSNLDQRAYEIAFVKLETSFDFDKSQGYKKWLSQND